MESSFALTKTAFFFLLFAAACEGTVQNVPDMSASDGPSDGDSGNGSVTIECTVADFSFNPDTFGNSCKGRTAPDINFINMKYDKICAMITKYQTCYNTSLLELKCNKFDLALVTSASKAYIEFSQGYDLPTASEDDLFTKRYQIVTASLSLGSLPVDTSESPIALASVAGRADTSLQRIEIPPATLAAALKPAAGVTPRIGLRIKLDSVCVNISAEKTHMWTLSNIKLVVLPK